MKKTKLLIASLLIFSVGCGEDEPTDPKEPFEVLYERELTGQAPQADIDALVQGNTQFAFEIYERLANTSENFIFSPLSISRAFSNYYLESAANFEQFRDVFHYLPDASASEDAFRALSVELMSRNTSDKRASFFESSDIYWVDSGDADGLSNLNFDRVHALPIKENPEYARGVINDWISDRSRGLLPDFLAPGMIDEDTFRVTTNAVFFVGNWVHEYSNKNLEFKGQVTKPVKAFGAEEAFRHKITDEYTMVQMPYTEGYTFVAVMPQDLTTFTSTLSPISFASLLNDHDRMLVRLRIPEISAQSEPDIVGAITELRDAAGFDTSKTLTGAYRETFLHKAVIQADKDGTTAAAATVIIEYGNNVPEPVEPIIIDLDKPFIYFIIEDRTESILFMGHFVGE